MQKKLKIKPVHLVLSGLVIIALGILIPSLFISAFSTIGFSVIIGSLILVSAYVFFAINTIKSRGYKTLKWLLIPVVAALLIGGGFFANNKYKDYMSDKIYSTEETIDFPDFTLKVDKPSFSTIRISVPQDKASRYGGLDVNEDCSKYPEDNNQPKDYYNEATRKWVFYSANDWERDHPTAGRCESRNDSRSTINKYISNNERIDLSYSLTAKNNVTASKINVSLMPDSGRSLSSDATLFDYDSLLSKGYADYNYEYKPNGETKLEGDINKGITRRVTTKADIRKSENTIDLKVVYMGEQRIIRINK